MLKKKKNERSPSGLRKEEIRLQIIFVILQIAYNQTELGFPSTVPSYSLCDLEQFSV